MENENNLNARSFARSRAETLIKNGEIRERFKDILDFMKEYTLDKKNRVTDLSRHIKEYAKRCYCNVVERGREDTVRGEFEGIIEEVNKKDANQNRKVKQNGKTKSNIHDEEGIEDR